MSGPGYGTYRSPWRERLPDFPEQTALGTLDPRTFILYQTSHRGSKHLLLTRSASPDLHTIAEPLTRSGGLGLAAPSAWNK